MHFESACSWSVRIASCLCRHSQGKDGPHSNEMMGIVLAEAIRTWQCLCPFKIWHIPEPNYCQADMQGSVLIIVINIANLGLYVLYSLNASHPQSECLGQIRALLVLQNDQKQGVWLLGNHHFCMFWLGGSQPQSVGCFWSLIISIVPNHIW